MPSMQLLRSEETLRGGRDLAIVDFGCDHTAAVGGKHYSLVSHQGVLAKGKAWDDFYKIPRFNYNDLFTLTS
jgi:hypothetical protein